MQFLWRSGSLKVSRYFLMWPMTRMILIWLLVFNTLNYLLLSKFEIYKNNSMITFFRIESTFNVQNVTPSRGLGERISQPVINRFWRAETPTSKMIAPMPLLATPALSGMIAAVSPCTIFVVQTRKERSYGVETTARRDGCPLTTVSPGPVFRWKSVGWSNDPENANPAASLFFHRPILRWEVFNYKHNLHWSD